MKTGKMAKWQDYFAILHFTSLPVAFEWGHGESPWRVKRVRALL
jgi:hypothetical protein